MKVRVDAAAQLDARMRRVPLNQKRASDYVIGRLCFWDSREPSAGRRSLQSMSKT